jgi:triacylglycerol lipase
MEQELAFDTRFRCAVVGGGRCGRVELGALSFRSPRVGGDWYCKKNGADLLCVVMNIVLMHGVLGFGRILTVDYFNGVAYHLKATFPRANVLTTTVSPIGMVDQRAHEAAHQIASATTLEADKPIHIIAHSMGGLDARFLVSKNLEHLQSRIRTVVCLGTPHLGSPVASLLDVVNPFELFSSSRSDSRLIDELREKRNAVHDLSAAAANQFNLDCPDVPTVHYFDIAGIGRDALFPTSVVFHLSHLFVSGLEGQNDGVVSRTSASRNRTPSDVWHADHADMVGHDLNGPTPQSRPAFDYLSAYDRLVRDFILKNQ